MKIILNNNPVETNASPLSLQALTDEFFPGKKMLLCKVNGQVVKQAERKEYMIQDGDRVIIVPIVAGG